MQLGLVSAILPEWSLSEVVSFAARAGFDCVELMCWPAGAADRRYAGVTHIDVNALSDAEASRIRGELQQSGVACSGLGYYPNPLTPDPAESAAAVEQLKRVIAAAPQIGVGVVNTFIGRDWTRSVDENWPRLLDVWGPLVAWAEQHGVRIAIENCPMFFTGDEWPGGKNLANSPAIWRRLFRDLKSASLGLNYDPSHFVWQQMDHIRPLREFRERLFHIHAKDVRVDRERLDDEGILACPLQYHTPKLPGLGDIAWGRFLGELADTGYDGAVCVEVEDRAYEGSLERRCDALTQSLRFLRNYL